MSPTVGAYFFAEDYVKFCKNLKYYLAKQLVFIPLSQSKFKKDILNYNHHKFFIAKLDDVEIIFLHYPNEKVIFEKWNRRVKRINWERIILKFSYQNECNDSLVEEFLGIQDYPKFVLVGERVTCNNDEIVYKRSKGKETLCETNNFGLFLNPIKILNERL